MELRIFRAKLGIYYTKFVFGAIRATPAVSQNREQNPFLDAKGEKRCSTREPTEYLYLFLLI